MVQLKNSFITLDINELGAEPKSLVCDGVQYLWEGRAEVWGASAPLMFPICGGLKDDSFTYCGKKYNLEKHGYARFKLFEVESKTDTEAVFLHRSDAETLVSFPFPYELRVKYELSQRSVKISYFVKNVGDGTMYFNIGSHEGYYTPEGIEDYDIIFPEDETLDAFVLYGNLLSHQRLPIINKSRVLSLYDKYFTVDALVFKDVKSRSAILRNRKTGRAVNIDFPDSPYFVLWHKQYAPYICVEPWNGVQDAVDASGDITEKEGITALSAGETFIHRHTITIL